MLLYKNGNQGGGVGAFLQSLRTVDMLPLFFFLESGASPLCEGGCAAIIIL